MTSTGGSFASVSISSAVSDLPSSKPPRIASTFVLVGGIAKRLCDRDGIAVGLDERDRRRALEQGQQRVRTRGLGRAAGERVLDDREAGAVLE